MTSTLPSLATPSRRRLALAWAGSTALAALLVSGLAALAMALEAAGASMGDDDSAVLVMLPPIPAVDAMAEPRPDATIDPPSAQSNPPEAEETPETPRMTEAPTVPEAAAPPKADLAEKVPEVDPPPPAPVAIPAAAPEPDPVPRPKARPERVAKTEKPAEKPDNPKKKAAKAELVKTPGKAKSEASAGAAAAKPKAGAKSAGTGKAAAKSYAAEVKKKINRTRRKPVSGRGSATVAFTISDSGGIGAISIAKSSGNAAVDRAALDHVRRTAPFPPPPEGAGRTFSYTHTSK